MSLLDWSILIFTLLFIVGYGLWKTKGSKDVRDYVLGGKEANWATVGLSVMATQASAITFLSTPGQAYHDGMGFVQFYFGLPLAMLVIILVFIPLYDRLQVETAYEFLEKHFNGKTRTLTALLFLVQRGLSAGITIFAPAIILSAVLGWPLKLLVLIIGGLVIVYTVSGGTKAVNVTQKQQMFVIMGGMFVAFYMIVSGLPADVNFSKALTIAEQSGKLDFLDFSLDPNNRYTFWSGITGGFFLALSYFGTDQSQVQRYLSGKSKRESQLGMIFNGLLKVPMQFFILFVGVMVFVFFQFNRAPLNFNPEGQEVILESSYATEYQKLQNEHLQLQSKKETLIKDYVKSEDPKIQLQLIQSNQEDLNLREKAKTLIENAALEVNRKVETNDKDYVFIHFILKYLPTGLIGLLLAVILSAAMSSTASELNALASTTAMDLYKRNQSKHLSEEHMVKVSKLFT